MTRPRCALVSLADTPWYHVVNRCVRRAFLCGHDAHSGQDFEHRRGWVETRIRELASVFAIDVAAYAVMSNHYHVVLRVDAARARGWSDEEVLRRWTQLFTGPLLVQQFLQPPQRALMGQAQLEKVQALADTYRARLFELSWFMRVLNESIARQANAEDGVKGRFWEGRFKSQALLDEQAILAAMVYVDLNPIRAQMTDTPEDSDYTSVAERLADARPAARAKANPARQPEPSPAPATPLLALKCEAHLAELPLQPLMPFDATARLKAAIPFAFDDYLELVETTGRCVRKNKRGAIAKHTPRLLERLNIEPERFIDCATQLMRRFGSAIGAPAHLTELCAARQVKYLRGMAAARGVFERRAA